MAPKDFPPFFGRYEVVDRLNHGGMADVYRARDPRLGGRAVAIKVPRVADDGLRVRMLQEAAIAGNLIHDNIVRIYDFGEQDGQPFIVMEFVEGVTLEAQVRSGIQVSLVRKLELIEQLAAGLQYAHTFRAEGISGIVHRDIKPANLIIDRRDILRILDFGIARLVDSRMTLDKSAIGTPNYMSPEQVEGGSVDRRSDIFSAGLVFYELLSYRQAFQGNNFYSVTNAVVRDVPASLRSIQPDLDPALDAIVSRAIQKDPARRYQSMGELAADVARVRTRLRPGPGRVENDRTAIVPMPPPSPTPRPSTNRPGISVERLSKRRVEAVDGHLQKAQAAYGAQDFAAALSACEDAALISPDEPRVMEWLDRCRSALDEQRIASWLEEARGHFDQQAFDEATALIDRVLEIDPTSEAANQLQAAIRDARTRAAAVRSALDRARQLRSTGQLESAIRAASEALLHDPTSAEAQQLSREAIQALNERRQREAHERAARALVDEQRRVFASGRRREAIAALEAFSPPHEIVGSVLSTLQQELARLEAWAAGQIEKSRHAIAAGRYLDAIEMLREVESTLPGGPDVPELLRLSEFRQAEVEAAARREEDRVEQLRSARAQLAAGRLDEAAALIESVLTSDPSSIEALALRGDVSTAVDAKRRQEELDRAAAAAVERARRDFAAGLRAEALASLDAFTPSHPLVSDALADLGREWEAEQAKARELAERQQDEERRRAELDASARVAEDPARIQQQEDDRRRLGDVLDRARRADSALDAVEMLRRELDDPALTSKGSPFHKEREAISDLLASRQAEVISGVERLIDYGEYARALEMIGTAEAAGASLQLSRLRQEAEAALLRNQPAEIPRSPDALPSAEVEALAPPAMDSQERSAPHPPVGYVPARAARSPWIVPAALVGSLAVASAGVWYLAGRSSTHTTGGGSTVTTTVVVQLSSIPSSTPTTVPAATVPPTSVPVNVGPVVSTGRSLLSRGDVTGAVRVAVGGLGQAPNDAGLVKLIQDILQEAARRAAAARGNADAASGGNRTEYGQGVTHLNAAEALRRAGAPDRANQAVAEYVAAAQLFAEAARPLAQNLTSSTPVSIPVPATTSVPVAVSVPSSSTPSTAPTSIPPALSTGIEPATVQGLLRAYAGAYGSLNIAELSKVQQNISEATRQRIEALRRDNRRCNISFSNVQTITSSGTDALVRADGQESCNNGTGKRAPSTSGRYQFQFSKIAGTWRIAEVFVSY